MLVFLADKDSFLLADAAEEVVKEYWNAYHAYRYDMYISFLEYLRGNGVHARKLCPRDLNVFKYNISGINVSMN